MSRIYFNAPTVSQAFGMVALAIRHHHVNPALRRLRSIFGGNQISIIDESKHNRPMQPYQAPGVERLRKENELMRRTGKKWPRHAEVKAQRRVYLSRSPAA